VAGNCLAINFVYGLPTLNWADRRLADRLLNAKYLTRHMSGRKVNVKRAYHLRECLPKYLIDFGTKFLGESRLEQNNGVVFAVCCM